MIIGLVAKKGFGKTTASNILKKHWGDEMVQINFKDGLIAELKQNFPDLLREIEEQEFINRFARCDMSLKYGIDLFAEKPPLIRALMQNYGTEVRRRDNPNYWVNKWIDKAMLINRNIVVDDVRFNNEAEAVKVGSGILIRLNRTDLQSTDTHQSETEQDNIKCDYEITLGANEQDKLEEELLRIIKNHGN